MQQSGQQAKQIGNYNRFLRSLAAHDAGSIEPLLEMRVENQQASGLDPRIYSIVKIAGLVGMNASAASYAWQVGMARESGVSNDEIMGVLVALAPTIGMARVVAAATEMALAMDVDLDEEPKQEQTQQPSEPAGQVEWQRAP